MRLHSRIILPDYWSDSDTARWVRDMRQFYIGLWQCADDAGCVEYDAYSFTMLLYSSPMDKDITIETLEGWLAMMIYQQKVIPYLNGGKWYLFLKNFHKHQRMKNPCPPEVPLPSWVTWVPYESNPRAGKYEVSYNLLTDFLQSSYTKDGIPASVEFKKTISYTFLTEFLQSSSKRREENTREAKLSIAPIPGTNNTPSAPAREAASAAAAAPAEISASLTGRPLVRAFVTQVWDRLFTQPFIPPTYTPANLADLEKALATACGALGQERVLAELESRIGPGGETTISRQRTEIQKKMKPNSRWQEAVIRYLVGMIKGVAEDLQAEPPPESTPPPLTAKSQRELDEEAAEEEADRYIQIDQERMKRLARDRRQQQGGSHV